MKVTFLGSDEARMVGAIVVTKDTGDIAIDVGPADGPPMLRLKVSRTEALQLSANLRAVANGRDEEILLAEE
jgi:hypothetical protein